MNQPDDATQRDEEISQAVAAYLQAVEAGHEPDRAEWLQSHAGIADELTAFLRDRDQLAQFAAGLGAPSARPADDATLAPGDRASSSPLTVRSFGDYELLEEIARGGMGVVYRARQVSLNRLVALKMILEGQLASPEDVARFRAEAEAAANLDHPNIVPIFEVGEHDGRHYFSMKLIEGGSLSGRVADFQDQPRAAAQLVATVARAVHHAHQRGILHRDLKPGNILLQEEGTTKHTKDTKEEQEEELQGHRGAGSDGHSGSSLSSFRVFRGSPLVTDFGLAKRVEGGQDRTRTGAIVGTPAYMAPEQARAEKGLTVAADVYSLGAILYELLTGRPPFRGPTPLDVILQVLEREPEPPRLRNLKVERDLETICLKCLQKEPARRYESAQALAEDLARWLADEPIRARRVGTWERAGRWLWKRRRSAGLTAATVLLTLALLLGGFWGLQSYQLRQQGRLELTTDGPDLTAEVLADDGSRVLARFAVPTEYIQRFPAGDYRLRLSGPGALSETLLLSLAPGEHQKLSVGLSNQPLGPLSLRPEDFADVIDLDGQPDLIVVEGSSKIARDRAVGGRVWERSLSPDAHPALKSSAAWVNSWSGALGAMRSGRKRSEPRLVVPAPDLDGDGVRDLLFLATGSRLLALSGKTGEGLWYREEMHMTPPVVCEVEGKPALVTTGQAGNVAVLAGRTGQPLWQAQTGFAVLRGEGARPVRVGGQTVVAFARGTELLGWDAASGKSAWPNHPLGFPPLRPPQYVDLDGDGRPECLLLAGPGHPEARDHHPLRLLALSLPPGAPRWQTDIHVPAVVQFGGTDADWPPTNWPLLADLDGDGKPEVLVPACDIFELSPHQYAGVEAIDGATGKSLWLRKLRSAPHQPGAPVPFVNHFVAGPDIDGDGVRDVFVVLFDPPGHPTVEALSGKDGHTLWWRELPHTGRPGAPRWWEPPGELPRLLVPVNNRLTAVVSADGQLLHVVPEVPDVRPIDLNGDGVPELVWEHPSNFGTVLHRVYVPPGERWRRRGKCRPTADLDGDGMPDLLIEPSDDKDTGPVGAISGRSGHWLWRADLDRDQRPGTLVPLGTDLDGDGVEDVLHLAAWNISRQRVAPLALSGRTGRRLWGTGPLFDFERERERFVAEVSARGAGDLDGDGIADVLLLVLEGHMQGDSSLRLSARSGRDGRELWQRSRAAPHHFAFGGFQPHPLMEWTARTARDAEGPIVLTWGDALEVLPNAVLNNRWALTALDGRDGRELWRHVTATPPVASRPGERFQVFAVERWGNLTEPVVDDLDGDGHPEVLLTDVEADPADGGRRRAVAHCLDARSGLQKWSYAGPSFPAGVVWPGAPPKVVRLKSGRHVCVTLPGADVNGPRQLVLLDARGREVQRALVCNEGGTSVRFWVGDLEGRGADDVLSLRAGHLVATRDGLEKELWRVATPASWDAGVLAVLPAREGRPAVAVTWVGNDVRGVAGPTGRLLWRARLPRSVDGSAPLPGLLDTHEGLPRLTAELDNPPATVCYEALPVDDHARYVASVPKAQLPLMTEPPPGSGRPLPWTSEVPLLRGAPSWGPVALGGVALALWLPWRLARHLWRRRTRRGRLLAAACLTAPFVIGLGGTAIWGMRPEHLREINWWQFVLTGTGGFLLMALSGAPMLAALARLARLAWGRRWRGLTFFLAATALAGAALAAACLWYDRQYMLPGEYYSWRGSYLSLVVPALYAIGALLILFWLARAFLALVRRLRLGRLSARRASEA